MEFCFHNCRFCLDLTSQTMIQTKFLMHIIFLNGKSQIKLATCGGLHAMVKNKKNYPSSEFGTRFQMKLLLFYRYLNSDIVQCRIT